jgi:hypothetical protein
LIVHAHVVEGPCFGVVELFEGSGVFYLGFSLTLEEVQQELTFGMYDVGVGSSDEGVNVAGEIVDRVGLGDHCLQDAFV